MAIQRWLGNAAATTDVWTLTPGGTIEVGDKFNVTCGGKTVSVAATGTTVAVVCDDIVAALNALDETDYPEFAEYAFTDSTTHVTATAEVSGVPGTFSVATTESNGSAADAQTFIAANTTAATGPNHWDNAANWSSGSLPADADTVVIEDSAVNILYGLAQSAIQPATMTIDSTFTGKIGLPRRNVNGYQEYRATYLAIGPVVLNVGQGSGSGSGRIKIDAGTDPCAVTVYGTGTTAERGVEAFLFKGTSASNSLSVTQGSVGVAVFAGETADLTGGLRIGYEDNRETDAKVRCGSGATVAAVTQTGGEVEINSAMTTVDRTGGRMTHRGASSATTINNHGGEFRDESTGTYTTVVNMATFDRRRVVSGKTITTMRVYRGSRSWIAGVTLTNPLELHGCDLSSDDNRAFVDFGLHKKITFAAI